MNYECTAPVLQLQSERKTNQQTAGASRRGRDDEYSAPPRVAHSPPSSRVLVSNKPVLQRPLVAV